MAASSLSEYPLNCSVFPFRSMSKLTVNSAIISPHLSLFLFLFVLWFDKLCFIVYNKDDDIFTIYFLSSFLSSDCARSRFSFLLAFEIRCKANHRHKCNNRYTYYCNNLSCCWHWITPFQVVNYFHNLLNFDIFPLYCYN